MEYQPALFMFFFCWLIIIIIFLLERLHVINSIIYLRSTHMDQDFDMIVHIQILQMISDQEPIKYSSNIAWQNIVFAL